MRRGRLRARALAVLSAGLCAVAAASALAAPARSHAAHKAKPHTCQAPVRRHGKHPKHTTCRPAKHVSSVHPAKSPAVSTPTKQGAPATSTGSPSPAPGAPAPTGTPEPGAPSTPPSVPHVQVTAVEYHYTLSRATVPHGKVIFEFVNDGEDEHNLNMLPAEGPVAGSFANTPSKGIRDQEIELRPGAYTLFCSMPEHEQKGMKATLIVE
jgi:plastocyanin